MLYSHILKLALLTTAMTLTTFSSIHAAQKVLEKRAQQAGLPTTAAGIAILQQGLTEEYKKIATDHALTPEDFLAAKTQSTQENKDLQEVITEKFSTLRRSDSTSSQNSAYDSGFSTPGFKTPQGGSSSPMISAVEKEAYEQQIKNLEAVIQKLTLDLKKALAGIGGSSATVSETLKKAIAEFKTYVDTTDEVAVNKVKDLITLIKDEGVAEVALEADQILTEALKGESQKPTPSQKKLNSLFKAVDLLINDAFMKEVIEKEAKNRKALQFKTFLEEGKAQYETLAKKPDVNMLKNNPLLTLVYIDPFYFENKKLITTYFSPIVTNYYKYTDKEDLLAALYYLRSVVKIAQRFEDGAKRSEAEELLYTLYQYVENYKPKTDLSKMKKFEVTAKNGLIEEVEKYFIIDYKEKTTEILKNYKADYDVINIPAYLNANTAQSPILMFLTVNHDQIKSKFGRAFYDKANDLVKYATVQELKAIVYHFAQEKLITENRDDHRVFIMNLDTTLQEREEEGKENREATITPIEFTTFQNSFNKATN